MKKNIITTDEWLFNKRIKAIEDSRDAFQNLLDEFNNLKLFKISSIDELVQLALKEDEYIKGRLTHEINESSISLFGLKISRAKAVDLLELPDLTQLKILSSKVRGTLRGIDVETGQWTPDHTNQAKQLTLSGSKINIDSKTIETIRELYSVIAHTPDHEAMAIAFDEACAALSKFSKTLQKAYGGLLIHPEDKFNRFFWFNGSEVIKNDTFLLDNRRHMFPAERNG